MRRVGRQRLQSGALSHSDALVVCIAARECLRLWDRGGRGLLHAQSRRFLCPHWYGLDGSRENPDLQDPPLRPLVERLANGETILDIQQSASDSDIVGMTSLLYWLAAMRHAPQLNGTL